MRSEDSAASAGPERDVHPAALLNERKNGGAGQQGGRREGLRWETKGSGIGSKMGIDVHMGLRDDIFRIPQGMTERAAETERTLSSVPGLSGCVLEEYSGILHQASAIYAECACWGMQELFLGTKEQTAGKTTLATTLLKKVFRLFDDENQGGISLKNLSRVSKELGEALRWE